MTRDDVIRWAWKAGAYGTEDALGNAIVLFDWAELERFSALVAAAEREECAKACENLRMQQEIDVRDEAAAAIRARKPA